MNNHFALFYNYVVKYYTEKLMLQAHREHHLNGAYRNQNDAVCRKQWLKGD